MLVIKKRLILSSTYTYAAIGAVAFIVTFGTLSVAVPQLTKDRAASDSTKIAKAKETQAEQNVQASMRKVTFSTQEPSLADTSVASKSRHASASTSSKSASVSTVSTHDSTSPSNSERPPAQPEQSDSNSNTVVPAQQQEPSLVDGVIGGLGGVVDALL